MLVALPETDAIAGAGENVSLYRVLALAAPIARSTANHSVVPAALRSSPAARIRRLTSSASKPLSTLTVHMEVSGSNRAALTPLDSSRVLVTVVTQLIQ